MAGNDKKYDLDNVEPKNDSPIKGKKIIFLGSSVTFGSASEEISFVEYLEKRNGIEIVAKEAVSGTTLADVDEGSYVHRMIHNISRDAEADLLLCQLSTNDAARELELGVVSDSMNRDDFDTKTITGAMEYIISYARDTWNCKVAFYTGSWFDSERYNAMVERLLELQKKWDIGVIDMWNNEEFNNIDSDTRKEYMCDVVHPYKAGYLLWWTPYIEEYLYAQDWKSKSEFRNYIFYNDLKGI